MSQSAQDAHDQPRQTRPLELGGSPWPEGGREGGRERARGGGGREPSRAEAGRKGPSSCQKVGEGEGVPPKSRPPRPGTRRPASPAAASPPSRGASGWDVSFFQLWRFWGGIGRSTPLSSLLFPASQVSHHSSF